MADGDPGSHPAGIDSENESQGDAGHVQDGEVFEKERVGQIKNQVATYYHQKDWWQENDRQNNGA